ncbi:hypothetical protein [Candidatus Pantoea floridensis]|uniref:Apea-like HEPN domain-containing protein n=1 Tax=Candidatus Pantoea floridensis TaxID=1938870 RepID=A0A286BQQ9_9GAMM|nr:hypothetical protein [Pantoea floridensis]PIF23042.1 hypothetical protein BX596_2475 [Enterobacteriaceae bacterium JKS000233]SOD36460.1 hypothetical protein SAMN06273570_0798 [Pantoea floridensis]
MIDNLCYEFFREFARYEYCLKATGFRFNTRDAKANWDMYAMAVTHVFESPEDPELKAAIEYFLNFPPKKQVVNDGVLAWDQTPMEEKIIAKKILILIRRVRNNLFHGGKFNGEWFEPERSEALMRNALIILRACGESHHEVSKAYGGIAC